ncbi:hypothetical protein FHS78_000609 [Parvibaculum indicum]|uniref:hypothetical protein n=1 Tax=Parvibaculum indicum TaxID=562969 RepID=UPI0014240772|nr:hypothetical protein [Parvibaculum indicum]NIJ40339.1 hypothetical protein [Parvibaculum indicum]
MLGFHALGIAPIGGFPVELAVVYEEQVVYAATEGFTTEPDDMPANIHFEGRLKSPPAMERSIIDNAGIGGAASIGFGSMELENSDGYYDGIVSNHAIDGRRVTIRLGDPDSFSYPEFGTVFDGAAEGWQLTEAGVLITLRDWGYQLEVPLARAYYGGTGGNDGTDDLAGKPIQQCWGVCENVPATLVDPLNNVWQVHDGPMQSVDAVYVDGVPLEPEYYDADLDAGTITPSVAVDGQVTADVHGAKIGGVYIETTADIVKAMATENGGWSDDRLDLAAFAAMNAIQPAAVGYCATEDINISTAIGELLGGIGGFRCFTRDGILQVGIFGEPEGDPAATFTELEIKSIERLQPPSGFYPPCWRRRVGYRRNWTVQKGGLASGVSTARLAYLAEEYRYGSAQDNTTRTAFLLAQDAPAVRSFFALKSDADAEAARLLVLTREPRAFYEVVADAQPYTLDPGAVVKLRYPRFDLAAGRAAKVLSVADNAAQNRVKMTVFV